MFRELFNPGSRVSQLICYCALKCFMSFPTLDLGSDNLFVYCVFTVFCEFFNPGPWVDKSILKCVCTWFVSFPTLGLGPNN